MKKVFIFFLLFPLLANSQSLKKADLIGTWKFKKFILTKEMPQDTIVEIAPRLFTRYGKIEDLKFTDLFISENNYESNNLKYDFWKINENKVLLYNLVPKDKLEYYKKYTFNVIKKLKDGKYYFTNPNSVKVLSLDKNQLIIEDYYYNIVYERK